MSGTWILKVLKGTLAGKPQGEVIAKDMMKK